MRKQAWLYTDGNSLSFLVPAGWGLKALYMTMSKLNSSFVISKGVCLLLNNTCTWVYVALASFSSYIITIHFTCYNMYNGNRFWFCRALWYNVAINQATQDYRPSWFNCSASELVLNLRQSTQKQNLFPKQSIHNQAKVYMFNFNVFC